MEIPVRRTSSEASLPSFFSNLLSKRTAPSALKLQHRHKKTDDINSILTTPRIIRLIVTWACFIEIGITTSLTGVALIDLKEALGSIQANQALIIINLSAGDVAGTLIGGYLADKERAEILSSGNLLITAFAGLGLNYSSNKYVILLCFMVLGFTNAFLEIVMEVWIINLWAGYGGTITHMAYFFYGLGTLISPIMVAPYLDEHPIPINGTKVTPSLDKFSRVFIPYQIIAFYCLLLSISLGLISFTKEVKDDQTGVKKRSANKEGFVVEISIMIFFFLLSQSIAGLDSSVGLLLINFAVVSDETFTKAAGVRLSVAYWVTYTFTRIITMLAMRYVHDRELMWIHLSITGSGILLLWFNYRKKVFLWISTIIIGAGISPTSPLILSYFNSYIKVTGKIATIFMLGDCFGEFFYPTILDYTVDHNPLTFVFGIFFTIFSSMVYLFCINLLLKHRQSKIQPSELL